MGVVVGQVQPSPLMPSLCGAARGMPAATQIIAVRRLHKDCRVEERIKAGKSIFIQAEACQRSGGHARRPIGTPPISGMQSSLILTPITTLGLVIVFYLPVAGRNGHPRASPSSAAVANDVMLQRQGEGGSVCQEHLFRSLCLAISARRV